MSKQTDQSLAERLHLFGRTIAVSHAWTPNTDVYETPDTLVVRLEIAGISKDDLEITLNERLLVIRGCRKDPCRQGRCSFRQMEIDYGPFERRIIIPRSVDARRVRAQFQNGFLQIELPKAATSEHHTVTVIIGEPG
jgi:HSP20 family protein